MLTARRRDEEGKVMLSERRCAAMIPASDIDRAKKWYAETLGFEPTAEFPDGVQYASGGGTEFWLYPSQFAGTNQATAMGWLAEDLSSEMDDLKSRGVRFEEYDLPGVQTVEGVAEFAEGERGAWFKDSEGNILALFESARYG
jgi:catechol 2,3-dioxygenase-like lactoylglutathione lyase family enzyme